MKTLLLNLLLALVWVLSTEAFTPWSFLVGFGLGMAVLRFLLPASESNAYFTKAALILRFVGFYAVDLLRSSIAVAGHVLRPRLEIRPAVLAIPLDANTDEEIMILSNLLTYSPGTLCVDVSEDRKTLYLHVMDVEDVEESRRAVKLQFERRVLELTR